LISKARAAIALALASSPVALALSGQDNMYLSWSRDRFELWTQRLDHFEEQAVRTCQNDRSGLSIKMYAPTGFQHLLKWRSLASGKAIEDFLSKQIF
jgi:hypothetical protein